MDALSVSPVGPATLRALSGLRPVPAPPAQPAPVALPSGASALSVQSLAQSLFQRTLQAAATYPVAEPATGSAGLAQDTTASLLAALNSPQAPAGATAAPDTTPNPAVLPTSSADASTAPPSAPPATTISDLPAPQDASAASLTPDFAMQTALRFGAGVVAQAAATGLPALDQGPSLVRDATTVLRLGNLQPRTGGPGQEAFAQPEAATQRILRTYETGSTLSAPTSSAVDLLA